MPETLDNLGNGIYVCLYGGCHDVCIGGESVIDIPLVLYLDMDLAHIVSTSCYGLDQIFLEIDFPVDQAADSLEGGIDRAVSARGGHAFFAVDDEFYR